MIRYGQHISALHDGQTYVGRVIGVDDLTGAITIDEGGLLTILPADALVLSTAPAPDPGRHPAAVFGVVILAWVGAATVAGALIGTAWAVHDWLS